MKKVRIEHYGDSVGIEFEASLHFQVWTVSAETPHGKRFAATGTHVVKLPGDGCRLPDRPDWNEVYKELKSTVNFGIVDCPSDCEYCKGKMPNAGDVVSFQGPISLGGGLTAQVDHSQKWIAALNEDGEPRRFYPVKIDTLALRNRWVVKFAPRPMTREDFSK